ncbi:MAG: ubiquinol-cytochrome c reductase iron-sulfur subunit [Pirellulaceae bacterium]
MNADEGGVADRSLAARRGFLERASGVAMAGGLAGAYGTFGYMLGQFVYPSAEDGGAWLFVCPVDQLAPGQSLDFTSPAGARIVVARRGEGGSAEDFLALSSVCPHLGCRVHWELQGERFFCPCHNGAFDREGTPIEGPPKASNQSLTRYPLRVDGGLLFLQAPAIALASTVERVDSSDQGVA